ncbi:anaphase-promoting complex subunit 5 [Erpetoichthys calabaricus]|uniref:Anaphase-promoting complex subunit 5 n=1 Tax=Erpetoichthys calabaricus TaxID=27687 RepID=A0A8C4SW06_ERPCA|nr:anaphase-promoting complex subunit 5 [Erpetoichthys calabaricus]
MASVHDSLYFNPMMTNGVVHANVFGIKDWVTPYKIAVLVLLDEMTVSKCISLLEKRRLNKLILPLLQGPDMTLVQLLKTVEDCCPQLAYAVHLRLHLMADGELKDMESFFDVLPSPFNETESEAHKSSVVGLFMRHMVLAYNKLSFSQVYKLYKALQQYYKSYERKAPPASDATTDADMEQLAPDSLGRKVEKQDLDPSPSDDDVASTEPLSQKQAEYFLAQQAYFLKNDENKALKPAGLQNELNNMLKFNPDFAEAHYLSYLNSMRVQDVFVSTHSLLHYFDRLILSGSDSKSNGDEGYGRSLRYAALNLAALHCRFGHYQQAELALQEAIRIAQESSDHVCLQHCLSWLYLLQQMKGSDSTVLTEHSVKMAVHFSLPYLASLGIQSLVQQSAIRGKNAKKLINALKDTDILHWKHSMSELIDISIAQKTAIWRMYGKSTMALQQAQMLMNMNSLESVNLGVQQNNTEAFTVTLCHLAELHAEQGQFQAASEILKHLKERFPSNSQNAKLWMICEQKIQFDRALNDGKYHIAESLVSVISALCKTEGLYRKALVLKAQNQTSEAYQVLQGLLVYCEKTKCTEMTIRVMLAIAELYWRSSSHGIVLPLLLQTLALSREHHLQKLASETVLHLAFSQLMLGIPEQALNILHMAIEPILAHGAVMDKGRALLLVAKCQVVTSASVPADQRHQALVVAIQNLEEARSYFDKVDCRDRVRDIFYLQARLYHSLGKTLERNKCAMLFRQLNEELPSHGVPLLTRL